MKNSFLFLSLIALILACTSCAKEELIETAVNTETSNESNSQTATSNFRGGPIGFVLRPYVVVSGTCTGTNHSGNSYETLVYVTGAKPYARKINVFGWKNGNMSSIPNTYTIDVPAYSLTSSRINTFPNANARYTSIKVEVNQVLKQNSSGSWVTDPSAHRTTATIPVQNCYTSFNNDGGGIGTIGFDSF